MDLRTCVAAVVLICSSQAAMASEQSALRRVSCSIVRFYVARFSVAAAEAWACSKGAKEAEIETARRCLQGSPIVAVQN